MRECVCVYVIVRERERVQDFFVYISCGFICIHVCGGVSPFQHTNVFFYFTNIFMYVYISPDVVWNTCTPRMDKCVCA